MTWYWLKLEAISSTISVFCTAASRPLLLHNDQWHNELSRFMHLHPGGCNSWVHYFSSKKPYKFIKQLTAITLWTPCPTWTCQPMHLNYMPGINCWWPVYASVMHARLSVTWSRPLLTSEVLCRASFVQMQNYTPCNSCSTNFKFMLDRGQCACYSSRTKNRGCSFIKRETIYLASRESSRPQSKSRLLS